jgi:hypothetical protein
MLLITRQRKAVANIVEGAHLGVVHEALDATRGLDLVAFAE